MARKKQTQAEQLASAGGRTLRPRRAEIVAAMSAVDANGNPKFFGNIAKLAAQFGVSRWTMHFYISNDDELSLLLSQSRETMLDYAESSLFASVLKREAWAVTKILSTLGRNRGYSETEPKLPAIEELLARLPENIRQVVLDALAKAV